MGQRLNVEIHCDGECLANAYYHWSAYSRESAMIAEGIIEDYRKIDSIDSLRIAIGLLELTGAGVNKQERTLIEQDTSGKFAGIEFKDAVDRNTGLLSVTQKGMNETRYWEEGRVEIDIGTETVNFSVFHEWSLDDYKREYETENENVDSLPFRAYDLSCIKFSEINSLLSFIAENEEGFKTSCGDEQMVIRWIR